MSWLWRTRIGAIPVAAAVSLAALGCGGRTTAMPVSALTRPDNDSYDVNRPVRAQLVDGSVVVFGEGVSVARDAIRGTGTRFSVALLATGPVARLPFDSVVSLVALPTEGKRGLSSDATIGITMGAIFGGFILASVLNSQ